MIYRTHINGSCKEVIENMNTLMLMISLIWGLEGILAETPYHYISQVSTTTPQTLAPKPLFSPHDVRRPETNSRRVDPLNDGNRRYGTKFSSEPGVSSAGHVVYSDTPSSIYESDLWYPIYTDIQYPALVGVSQTPYEMSYGVLPAGYEPKIPLSGDPTGYSFSYQARDHHRQETSDGRGNFYSSFSFVPPANNPVIQQNHGIISTLDYGLFTTGRSPTVNIPSQRPGLHAASSPHSFNPSSTEKPLFSPSIIPHHTSSVRTLTGYPPQSVVDSFANGFYFESKKIAPKKIPEQTFQDFGHALSTNIQHNNVAVETSSKANSLASGSRRVTIESPTSSPVTTERSYQALSRSLGLAFSSQRASTVPSKLTSSTYITDRPISASSTVHSYTAKTLSPLQSFRTTSRRSATERPSVSSSRSTTFSPNTSEKQSVVQKIPRKLRYKINEDNTEGSPSRPLFIDDLTSLAYSENSATLMNNTIIQIKPKNDKNNESREALLGLKSITPNSSNNFSLMSDIIKDGYVTGNKTYLAGLGLRSNIHY